LSDTRKADWKGPVTGVVSAALAGISFALPEPWKRALFLVGSAAFVGWGTNAVAIRMLFDRFKFLGIPIPFTGVIPAKRESLIAAISHSVANKLVGPGALKEQVLKSDFVAALVEVARDRLRSASTDDAMVGKILEEVSSRGKEMVRSTKVREQLRKRLADGIKEKGFFARALVDPDAVGNAIVDTAHAFLSDLPSDPDAKAKIRELAERVPAAGSEHAKALEERLRPLAEGMLETTLARIDVEKIVKGNLEGYTDQQIKELVLRATAEHMGWLEVWGGVLGAISGVVMHLLAK
jgi:uncharacterized membrane protein YheB (UPF0754 family)